MTETRTEWRVVIEHLDGSLTSRGPYTSTSAADGSSRSELSRGALAVRVQQRTVTEWVDA